MPQLKLDVSNLNLKDYLFFSHLSMNFRKYI